VDGPVEGHRAHTGNANRISSIKDNPKEILDNSQPAILEAMTLPSSEGTLSIPIGNHRKCKRIAREAPLRRVEEVKSRVLPKKIGYKVLGQDEEVIIQKKKDCKFVPRMTKIAIKRNL
jgi:hypothetical protein